MVGSGWSAAPEQLRLLRHRCRGAGAAVPGRTAGGQPRWWWPALLVGVALMATGATVGVLSGGPPLRRALRQLAIGAGAAAVTYLLGSVFGAVTG